MEEKSVEPRSSNDSSQSVGCGNDAKRSSKAESPGWAADGMDDRGTSGRSRALGLVSVMLYDIYREQ